MSEIRGFSGISSSGAVNSGQSAAQRLHVGQRVEGMVVSVSEEGLAAISVAGRIITAQAAKHSLSVGEHLMLEITEISGDTVLASRINSAESAILSRLGMNLSDESLLFVGELLRNNQPIDADVLARLRSNSKEARLFLEQLSVFGADIEINIDTPIKTQLIRLLAASQGGSSDGASTAAASGGGISGGAASGVDMPKTAAPMHSVVGASVSAAGAEISAAAATPAQGAGAQSAGLAAVGQSVGAQGTAEQLSNAADGISSAALAGANSAAGTAAQNAAQRSVAAQNATAHNAVQQNVDVQNAGAQSAAVQQSAVRHSTVQQITVQQSAVQQSAAAHSAGGEVQSAGAAAVKNAAYTLLKAPNGVADVRDAALTLLGGFGAKQNVALVSTESALTLRNIALSNISTADIADELLALAKTVLSDKTVVSAVSALAKNDDAAGVFREIGGERAAVLSESVKGASRQENTQIYYIPVPIRIDREESRADIYYRKKSVRGDELNMLVALKTHNFGEVRCLVNKYLNSYVLGFAFESEEIAAIFRESLPELRRELHSLPVSEIFIRNRREVDKEFFTYADKRADFDVRI